MATRGLALPATTSDAAWAEVEGKLSAASKCSTTTSTGDPAAFASVLGEAKLLLASKVQSSRTEGALSASMELGSCGA